MEVSSPEPLGAPRGNNPTVRLSKTLASLADGADSAPLELNPSTARPGRFRSLNKRIERGSITDGRRARRSTVLRARCTGTSPEPALACLAFRGRRLV
jgi:hypothetical protein